MFCIIDYLETKR